jgi:hypothetical protein
VAFRVNSIAIKIAAPLQALLANLIDYAGLYPPAALPLPIVLERYNGFLASPDAWILNRLVLPAGQLRAAPIEDHWRVTLLVDEEPGPLPPQVETLETKLPRRLSRPTYCEAPILEISDAYAKVRTGGLTPEAIPSADAIADFLCDAAARRLPFKATAGLHHPLRSLHPTTYEMDSPQAMMHGFLNLFLAAAFAWHGTKRGVILEILNETEAGAFEFGAQAIAWGGHKLNAAQIGEARRDFAHSFGSCSFEEPFTELRGLDLLL